MAMRMALAAGLTAFLGAAGPAAAQTAGNPVLFDTSRECMACHNGLTGPAGENIAIGTDWRGSMMANAARDPYWQGAVRRETMDHPEAAAAIQHECSICHMPMAHVTARTAGAKGQVFAHLPPGGGGDLDDLAADGVSCTVCHQILPDNFGQRSSLVGGFLVDTRTPGGRRSIFGPFDVDKGRARIMRSSSRFEPKESPHIRESALCGTCHTLYTHSLGPGGTVVGELAEQMPYPEWLHSRYRDQASCQSCHLKAVDGAVAVSSVWGKPREGVQQHVFRGGNFLVPRILNLHRAELGVEALPAELEATAERTLAHLQTAAARLDLEDLRVDDGRLEVTVHVRNLAGHKLPTAYPSRRAWIHLRVLDARGRAVFESGRLRPDGSIEGNDNDRDPQAYEPHHPAIDSPNQVQIYEPILGGPDGRVTTGLLTATQYLKDNRLLPEGFDKATAGPDIRVAGAALQDDDFRDGGDRIIYRAPLEGFPGPYTVEAELRYQPIGYRWARNLEGIDADEPRRFVRLYDQAAGASSAVLASARAQSRALEGP
jgi:hypothetical protein